MALAFAGTVVAAETVITSDRLEKRTESDGDHFFFYDNVRIVATNLVATCDLMEVITAGIADQKASVAQFGAIEVIIARGDVRIEQASLSRTARADAAEIFPQKGEVVLTGNAEVTDAQGTVRGHRMRLVKGEEHAIVEGSAEGERPKVILPMIPDWDRIKPKNDHQNKAVGAPEGATQGEKALEVPDQPQPQDTL
jgi:lipopolysaccharide export system protein LptA